MRSNKPKLEIVYTLISSLRIDPRAPRKRDKRHVKQLAKSIDTFGFNVPVAIDDAMNIVNGHGRVEAALLLGMTEVPTIRLSHLSPQQRQAFMIADNRMSDQSRWDKQLLGEMLVELADADLDFDLDATGFSVAEIDLLIAPEDPFDGEGEEPMPGGPAVAQLGDSLRTFRQRFYRGGRCRRFRHRSYDGRWWEGDWRLYVQLCDKRSQRGIR